LERKAATTRAALGLCMGWVGRVETILMGQPNKIGLLNSNPFILNFMYNPTQTNPIIMGWVGLGYNPYFSQLQKLQNLNMNMVTNSYLN
jgi:hypothetical protein